MLKKDKANRVKLIANPGAGKESDATQTIMAAASSLKKNGVKVDVALAKPKEETTSIARRASKAGYPIVIAMGGDGTIEAVMRGLIGSKTHLGILPAGTQNNIAKSLGIPENMEEACALIAADHIKKLDAGQVKTRKGKKFVFFELATVGFTAAIYPDASKVAKGRLSKLKDTAVAFIRQEASPTIKLTMNGESKVEVETLLVMVSNTPIFGKKFRVAPQASLDDGLLDISVYPGFSKVELMRYYASVMDDGYSGNGKVQQYQARKLKVKSSPKLAIMADGIQLGKGTVTIKVLPGALRMIANMAHPDPDNSLKEKLTKQPETTSSLADNNHHDEKIILTIGS